MVYIHIFNTSQKKTAFPSAMYNIAYFNLPHYNFFTSQADLL